MKISNLVNFVFIVFDIINSLCKSLAKDLYKFIISCVESK